MVTRRDEASCGAYQCVAWCSGKRNEAERRGVRPGFGTRLVGHLNIAAIAGLPVTRGQIGRVEGRIAVQLVEPVITTEDQR